MGVQAVNHFRHDDQIKPFSGEQGVKALMVLHYKDPSEYQRIFSDKEDALSQYRLDPKTGVPISVETGFIEFVQGYDLVSTCYLSVKHGRFPNLTEIGYSVLDVADIGLTIVSFGAGGAILKGAKTGFTAGTKAAKTAKVVYKAAKEIEPNSGAQGLSKY